ncbi:hypothetical protein [Herbidospora cretacea]|uniref:hypothetical protein n=1 Tax=Herbidospora cretacea TaxID=28444 RepID=UPI0004C316E3|nr:hypothetical protein [Herbidospora cretacea]
MIPTPRTLISAGIVGVIVVGGVAVAATASAGRIEFEQQRLLKTVGEKAVETAETTPAPTPEPVPSNVVVRELESDPEEVSGYWTPENLEQAEPMEIPRVEVELN